MLVKINEIHTYINRAMIKSIIYYIYYNIMYIMYFILVRKSNRIMLIVQVKIIVS